MNSATEALEVKRIWRDDTSVSGQVFAFVSGKGGTGKTVISASTAYILLKAGLRVLAIDGDFSTRGLSLYLLGDITRARGLHIEPYNCLADSFLSGISSDEVQPVSIVRGDVTYDVIISNKDVWRGGVPDERFLGGRFRSNDVSPARYLDYLSKLCERFRREYDYVILDTRGGFDFTSAVPAAVADKYIITLEADKISVEQVGGLIKQVGDFIESAASEQQKTSAVLGGFIVNKALFSVDERVFPEGLARLYDAPTFGVIPSDRNTIRAYQKKDIPLERYPAADFSRYLIDCLDNLLLPSLNWRSPASIRKYSDFCADIIRQWQTHRRVARITQTIPLCLFLLVLLSIISYALYRESVSPAALPIFYLSLSTFFLISTLGAAISTAELVRSRFSSRVQTLAVTGAIGMAWIGVVIITLFDVPRTFSREILLARVNEQTSDITSLTASLRAATRTNADLTDSLALRKADSVRYVSTISDLQRQSSMLQSQLQQIAARDSVLLDSLFRYGRLLDRSQLSRDSLARTLSSMTGQVASFRVIADSTTRTLSSLESRLAGILEGLDSLAGQLQSANMSDTSVREVSAQISTLRGDMVGVRRQLVRLRSQ